jgi:hypothetical protein
MTLPRFSLLALASVAFATSLLADTVVLKNGTKIEGKITSETDTQITIESRSGGIIDEQTVKKDEVQSVSKTAADEAAYAPLRGIKLGTNSLPTAVQYDTYLTPLRAFVSKYPDSKYKAEIEKLVADFEAEQKRVTDGEAKLDGKWMNKTEVQRERYQINGMVAFNYMKEQSARGDAVGAMNTFDLLKKQYPGSRGYIEAVDTAKRLLPALKQQADARLARLPAENADREKAVAGSTGLNKIQLQGELDQEKQGMEAALAQAKRQGLRWPPFIPRSEDSMKQISTLAGEEGSQLTSVDVAKARQSIQLATEARAALDKKDFTTAEEKTRAARDAWGENEIATRLDAEIPEAKTAAAAKIGTPGEPAPAPTDATSTTETKPESKPETKSEEKPAESATASTESTAGSTSTETAAAEDEPNPLFRILLIIVIAIVAFVGLKAYRGIKKRSSEVIE